MWFNDETDDTTAADLGKGLLAGMIAGVAATWLMTQAQPHLQKWAKDMLGEEEEDGGGGGGGESATAQAAIAVAKPVLGRSLTKDEKETGSTVAHYGFGTVMGAVYGTVAEVLPMATTGMGLPAGAVLFLVADEVAVPALGLSDTPTQLPASAHVYGLASHLLYGMAVEACRKVIRPML